MFLEKLFNNYIQTENTDFVCRIKILQFYVQYYVFNSERKKDLRNQIQCIQDNDNKNYKKVETSIFDEIVRKENIQQIYNFFSKDIKDKSDDFKQILEIIVELIKRKEIKIFRPKYLIVDMKLHSFYSEGPYLNIMISCLNRSIIKNLGKLLNIYFKYSHEKEKKKQNQYIENFNKVKKRFTDLNIYNHLFSEHFFTSFQKLIDSFQKKIKDTEYFEAQKIFFTNINYYYSNSFHDFVMNSNEKEKMYINLNMLKNIYEEIDEKKNNYNLFYERFKKIINNIINKQQSSENINKMIIDELKSIELKILPYISSEVKKKKTKCKIEQFRKIINE